MILDQTDLQRAVAEMTCPYCAGAGRVATRVAKTFQGRVFTETDKVEDCHECDGSGIVARRPMIA